jgi:hypothetical protein
MVFDIYSVMLFFVDVFILPYMSATSEADRTQKPQISLDTLQGSGGGGGGGGGGTHHHISLLSTSSDVDRTPLRLAQVPKINVNAIDNTPQPITPKTPSQIKAKEWYDAVYGFQTALESGTDMQTYLQRLKSNLSK